MNRSSNDVVIVGAGLAGLACALHLHRNGVGVRVLDADDAVGGRIRTDVVDGYRLDRGFQVLLTAYPELGGVVDVAQLEPRAFDPGALVWLDGGFHRVSDPFRRPLDALRTLAGPVGSIGDKFRVAAVRARVKRGSVDEQLAGDDATTVEYLRGCGIGPSLLDRFFRPFLGGIFLDPALDTSSRMFRFVFRMFAEGEVVVPRRGMQAIPDQLAAALPEGTVYPNTPVLGVAPGRVQLEDGVLDAPRIVVATDGAQAADWLGGVRRPAWRRVRCFYFVAPRAPIAEPVLVLNGEGSGPINNLSFPTRVSADYGPGEGDLVSVTALRDTDVNEVRDQLARWFGDDARTWRHLRTYDIVRALPAQPPGWLEPAARPVRSVDGIYVCGDHNDTASTNGALRAGRRAAEAVLADRG